MRSLIATTTAADNIIVLATATCAAGCTAAQTTGTLAQVLPDELAITGYLTAGGTVSIVVAPSAGAAVTVQRGSFCFWW
jgi:hypothetical protein